jgi:hypothetical protein
LALYCDEWNIVLEETWDWLGGDEGNVIAAAAVFCRVEPVYNVDI